LKRGRRPDPVGYDAGKKVKGKKRHVLVDTPFFLSGSSAPVDHTLLFAVGAQAAAGWGQESKASQSVPRPWGLAPRLWTLNEIA
jgi:hypothetical protein